jgi:hypothetical protein
MKRALALCAVLLAVPVLAADGDAFRPTGRQRLNTSPLLYLCDSKVAADAATDCSDLKLPGIAASTLISVQQSDGCTAFSVDVKIRTAPTGDGHTLGTLSNLGTTMLKVEGGLPELMYATLTTLTNCTDLDVVVEVLRTAP